MSSPIDSNQLLRFMTAATSNIQEALNRQSNGKKVNHRKYIQKRLQRGTRSAKRSATKPATTTTGSTRSSPPPAAPVPMATTLGRQPIATMPMVSSSPYWPVMNDCQHYHHPASTTISQPSTATTMTSGLYQSTLYSRPSSSCQDIYDPEIESLLCEFGLDSPSQFSDTNADLDRRGSGVSQTSNSTAATSWDYLPPTEFIHSPSDFSDIDDSAYSSPRNPSPVYYPTSQSPQYYQHQVATASCEWLPLTTCSSSSTASHVLPPPDYLNLNVPTMTPSLNEILELVTP